VPAAAAPAAAPAAPETAPGPRPVRRPGFRGRFGNSAPGPGGLGPRDDFGPPPPPPFDAAPALKPDDIVGPITLSDESLNQVITLFEKLTGKIVLRPLLPGVRINFNGPEKITRAEAVSALESLLAMNAVSLSQVPGTDFYKATYIAMPIAEVPPLYTTREEVEKLPPTLKTISRLFSLKHTTAQALHASLLPFITSSRNDTLLLFPSVNALLFTSNTINVQRVEKVVAEVDIPNSVFFVKLKHVRASDVKKYFGNLYAGASPLRTIVGGDITIDADDLANHVMIVSPPQNREKVREIIEAMDKNNVELMFFKLKHIRASDAQKLIQSLSGGSSATAARPGVGMGAAATTPAFSNVLGGDLIISADDLANHLMIVAQPQVRERVQKLIEDMDKNNLPKTTSESISLKHSEMDTVMKMLQAIVVGSSGSTGTAATANRTGTTGTTGSTGSLTGTSSGTNLSRRTYNTTSFSTRRNTTQSVPGAYTWGPTGQVPATITAPGTPNSFSEHLTVSGEDRNNRLIVYGTEEDIAQIKEIVAKIDIPLPQVRIEAIIVEVSLNNGESSGLSSLGIGYKNNITGGADGSTTSQIGSPEYTFNASMPNTPGTSTPPFAVTGSLRDFSLGVVFGLAESNSRVRILSAPLISTTHNQEAKITVGERHPYAGSTNYTGSTYNSGVAVSTEFTEITIELSVLPRVSANGMIEMQVSQSNKSLAGTVNINGNDTPIVAERSAASILVANNNETVVLAGLQSYQEAQSKGIMWLLGYIPIIGEFFKPETNDVKRTEIIVFLRPHIITPDETNASDTTPGLLPGSLTRIDAKSYIDTGRFSAVSLTEEERETIEEIRRRQNTQAAATRDAQLRNEHSNPQ
jgi:general secretion pathway protein D